MGEIHACRVCMSTNVKLYNMFQNNLVTAYELLTGLEVILENKLPSFICVVCRHLLLKFTEFRETCEKTHDLLIFSYQQNYEVSTEYIESLNLNYSPLTKLSAHIVVQHDVTKTLHPDYSDSKAQVLPTDYNASQTELALVKTEECSNQFSDEVVMPTDYDASQTELAPVKTEECSNQFNDEVVMPTDYDASQTELDPVKTEECSNQFSNEVVMPTDYDASQTELAPVKTEECSNQFNDEVVMPTDYDASQTELDPVKTEECSNQFSNEVVMPTDYDASQTELAPVKTKECCNQFNDEVVMPTDYDASETELDPVKTEECSNQFGDEVVMDATEVNCKDDKAIEAKRPFRRNIDEEIKDTFTLTFLTAEQQMQELHARKLSRNYRNSFYKCEKCFKGFLTEVTFRKHLARHDPVCGGHECEICLRRLSTARILRHHVAKYHEREYRCKLCSFVTKTNCQAVEHAERHSGKVFICNTCGATFRKGSSYLAHVRLQHPSAEHVCDICGKSFVGVRGLQSLKMHAKKAHKAAAECNKTTFVCEICGKKFKKNSHLTYHRRKHTGETPFACTFCPKKYAVPQYLKDHIKKHTGETPFACTFCPKKYAVPQYLKVHIRKHTGETPFPCGECPKRFTDKAALGRHLKVHTGEKPYACDYCDKRFSQSQGLKIHIKTVHLKEPTPYKRKVMKKEDELCMDDDVLIRYG